MRVAIRDADVLGYVVPKGTDVYMLVSVHITYLYIFPAIDFRGGDFIYLTPYADDDDDDDLI